MRGPGLRLKYDVRRLWQCPECGYERHAPATEVTVRCHCNEQDPWMKLVEPQRQIRPAARPLDPYVEIADTVEDHSAAQPAEERETNPSVSPENPSVRSTS